MLHLFSPTIFAGIVGLGASEIVVLALILCIGLGVPIALIVVGLRFFFKDRERRRWHETARLALEKGQALPPPLASLEKPAAATAGPGGDFRAGLILVATGIGLYFLLGRGIAAVVGFIGVALLLYATGVFFFTRKNSPQDPVVRS